MAFSTMMLRRLYTGASFDSVLFKVLGPVINVIDRVAQSILGTNVDAKIPPFTLRARSAGVINQLGGRRFTESSSDFLDLVLRKEFLSKSISNVAREAPLVFDIGCGVGKLPRSLLVRGVNVKYIGVDIDELSVVYCQNNLTNQDYSYHLIDVSNGTYRPELDSNPLSENFDFVKDDSVQLIVSWSVFTHMEIEHIRHYLNVIERKLEKDGVALISAFVHDDRKWVNEYLQYEYNGGYIVNADNPMKAIGFKKEVFESAFLDAGLRMDGDFIPKIDPNGINHQDALGQDLFILRKIN